MLGYSRVDLGARRDRVASQPALRVREVLFDSLGEERGVITPCIVSHPATARQSREQG
jgi:hypothetical protein